MSDLKLRQLRNKFESDPEDIQSIVQFINLSKRLNLKFPEDYWEINHFCEKSHILLKSYIEAMLVTKIGDPSIIVMDVFGKNVFGDDKEWIRSVIERDKVGSPAWVAYLILNNKGCDKTWASNIIKNAVSGNPSWPAYLLGLNKILPRKWVKSVIKNDKTGEPSRSAFLLMSIWYSTNWAKSVIENAKIGDPAWYAFQMARYNFASKEWAKSIEYSSKIGRRASLKDWEDIKDLEP